MLARFLLELPDQDFQTDMRNQPCTVSRLLIVAALAFPAFAFVAGCKSTSAPTAPEPGAAVNDDATLAARVKSALAADPGLRPLLVSVATYRGVVQLSGYVDSEIQIQQALAVTRGVPGVQSISNDLHIKPQ